MPTTTLRLDEKLKSRVARLAKQKGLSPHSYMLAAIGATASQDELRKDFERDAEAGEAQVRATGKVLDLDEVVDWLKARAVGKKGAKPKARRSLLAK
jgi:predicted transcriptional regulator